MSRALFLLVALTALATTAQAQVWTPRPGVSPADAHRLQLDRHRAELDRLRAQADVRDIEARQQQPETRVTRMELEARRRPEPTQPPAYRPLRSPEEERALRQSAGDRRQATQSGVGQIDAWLDRVPD